MNIHSKLKNKFLNRLNVLFFVLCVLNCSCSTHKSSQEIYYDALNYVVEIKSISKKIEAYGTGVIIQGNMIVTNAHMVTCKTNGEYQELDSLYIRFATSDDYSKVSIVKYDLELDLAVLKSNDSISNSKLTINYVI